MTGGKYLGHRVGNSLRDQMIGRLEKCISDSGFDAKEKNRLDGEIQPVFTESLTQ